MKITAGTSILSLLKAGMVIRVHPLSDAPYVEMNRNGSRLIIAHRPKYNQTNHFNFTNKGLTDALQWACDGWHQIDKPTVGSQERPRPKW